MKATYSDAMRLGVFPHEGGHVNHPKDPGGETNYGITIAVARANGYSGPMRSIPIATVERIYRERYAKPVRYDDLPAGVDYCVLDYGINSGVGRSGKVLRRVCGLPDDTSVVSDEVIRAVWKRDPNALVNAICDERLAFLKRLKTWPVFGKGWDRRVREVRGLAHKFIAAEQVSTVPLPVPAPHKGEVPKATDQIAGATVGGTAAGTAAGWTAWDWVTANPRLSVFAAVGCVILIVLAIAAIQKNRQHEQEAKTPGFGPVPEAA